LHNALVPLSTRWRRPTLSSGQGTAFRHDRLRLGGAPVYVWLGVHLRVGGWRSRGDLSGARLRLRATSVASLRATWMSCRSAGAWLQWNSTMALGAWSRARRRRGRAHSRARRREPRPPRRQREQTDWWLPSSARDALRTYPSWPRRAAPRWAARLAHARGLHGLLVQREGRRRSVKARVGVEMRWWRVRDPVGDARRVGLPTLASGLATRGSPLRVPLIWIIPN